MVGVAHRDAYIEALTELTRERMTRQEIKNHIGKNHMRIWKQFCVALKYGNVAGAEISAKSLGVKQAHITALQTLLGYRDG